ncbi:hypothetical protein SAMN04488128_104418 [Chitinophaga eiseniae]|uniref:Uncharacterized protein n=1 Tax=Chitinophaga eiseniae TaxID=634771 RepID=A0A1T4TCZ2_9BACT|nr:hypothetical protein SAMN04488128_104418 [Chitinophaga eiseniae]
MQSTLMGTLKKSTAPFWAHQHSYERKISLQYFDKKIKIWVLILNNNSGGRSCVYHKYFVPKTDATKIQFPLHRDGHDCYLSARY